MYFANCRYRFGVIKQTLQLLFVSLSVFFAIQTASAEPIVKDIIIRGNDRIDQASVLLQINSEVGQPLSAEQVAQDIKSIYRTGFFDRAVVRQVRRSDGVELIYDLIERPAIHELEVEGNEEIDDEEFLEKLSLGARRFLDRRKIELAIEEVKKHYQKEGYFGTEIDYVVTPVKENQVDVTFYVKEQAKKRIRQIVFEGNKSEDSGDLEDELNTGVYSWWKSWAMGTGVVKEESLSEDVQRLNRYYLARGYVDVRVDEPVVEETEDGLKVTYRLVEGEVFSVGDITAEGALIENDVAQTLDGVSLKKGDVFNVEKLRADTFTISDKFTDIGYAFTNVDPQTRINRSEKSVDVSYYVNKGELIRVNRISIVGNEKTKDNVIRRSLKIHEQELFSSSRIRRSQELLQRLGYFDEVTITPEPSDGENEVDLAVSVREANTGSFSIGAGISSGEGFIATTRIAENNIFGTGNSLGLDVDMGSERENVVLSYNIPRVNDTHWSLGFNLLSVKREFDDFDRSQAGGGFTFGYPLWFLGPEYFDDVRFSIGYDLLQIDIDEVTDDAPQIIKDSEGQSVSSSVVPSIVRDTIDNPIYPTTGSRQVVSFETAGLGGDEEFWLANASNSWFYPLWNSPLGVFVFSQRTRLGYGDSFNNEVFPLFKRFFPGGINSVRGYDSRSMGPKDESGSEYGGSKQLIANFEVIFPIVDSVGINGVFFYDAGEAFDDNESIDVGELRQAVGWGIRWRSPIAPIRIEIGYPLDKEEGDKSMVTNFSFGAPM